MKTSSCFGRLEAAITVAAIVVGSQVVLAFAVMKAPPTADLAGAKDSPLLKRYEGSVIVSYKQQSFGELALPLSRLELVPDKTDRMHNRVHEPKSKKNLEGRYTRIAYLAPEGRSPLEVLRNYQEEIKGKGGRILFECKGEDCGGDPDKSSEGGGGDMSLAMYLYPVERITETPHTTGRCSMAERITDLRYTAAALPGNAAHVSVMAYTIVSPGKHDSCRALNERTIAVVDLVETKAREQKMVTVSSGEMARAISTGGRVALYGIYFDFNKTEVKPESDPTLEQIAKLLKETPALKLLVVGHTDAIGSFSFNMDLSQRRAAAVVSALATRYAVRRDRLTPVGVSFASPVASNQAEAGRAANRRVELVENSPASR
jgi:outer membrane protein OmpA-like peptidoglycan-associated protein